MVVVVVAVAPLVVSTSSWRTDASISPFGWTSTSSSQCFVSVRAVSCSWLSKDSKRGSSGASADGKDMPDSATTSSGCGDASGDGIERNDSGYELSYGNNMSSSRAEIEVIVFVSSRSSTKVLTRSAINWFSSFGPSAQKAKLTWNRRQVFRQLRLDIGKIVMIKLRIGLLRWTVLALSHSFTSFPPFLCLSQISPNLPLPFVLSSKGRRLWSTILVISSSRMVKFDLEIIFG